LVNERSTVFDRRAVLRPSLEDDGYALTPMGNVPTQWTADLVHCRLVNIAGLVRRLPPVKMPPVLRSFLGNLQPQDAPAVRSRPLSSMEAMRLDWTWSRIMARPMNDRAILQGMMAAKSVRFIARVLEWSTPGESRSGTLMPTLHPARFTLGRGHPSTRGLVDVRFAPKATELLRRRKLTRRATNGLMHRSKY